METVYVIGSGPSGIACALGLLARKDIQVVMLDVGTTLEKGRLENRLKSNSPIIYPFDNLPWENKSEKKFNKHLFGSIYPYDIGKAALDFDLNDVMLRASFARGGLSNVWGASIMPYRPSEITHWPISNEEIEFYYKRILEHLPFSTCFQEDFVDWPFFPEKSNTFQLSQQAYHLLQCYKKSKETLNANGIIVGGARLSVYQKNEYQNGCTYCGECMYGCTSDSIYSTRQTLSKLQTNCLFKYHAGIRVNKIIENNNSVVIDAIDVSSNNSVTFAGNRVFIAAGVLMSAQILMNSCEWLKDKKIKIMDSQHFLLPSLMFRRFKQLKHLPSHTMSQLFYEIVDSNNFNDSVHLQLHTYISLYENEFENKIKYLKKFRKLLKPFYERLIVFQGFLPSKSSGVISVNKHPKKNNLIITGEKNENTIDYIRKTMKLFLRHSYQLGFMPLTFASKISQIGISNHHGASFPIKKKPEQMLESNFFGVPNGFKRTHVVDASVLPSIQAQSVTLMSMINAYRIGYSCELN